MNTTYFPMVILPTSPFSVSFSHTWDKYLGTCWEMFHFRGHLQHYFGQWRHLTRQELWRWLMRKYHESKTERASRIDGRLSTFSWLLFCQNARQGGSIPPLVGAELFTEGEIRGLSSVSSRQETPVTALADTQRAPEPRGLSSTPATDLTI